MKKNIVLILKILITVIVITNFILNIKLITQTNTIKKDIHNMTWDINAIDRSVDSISDNISDIQDDIRNIKNTVDDIDYYLQ